MKQGITTTARKNADPLRDGFGGSLSVWLWICLVALGVCGRIWQPTWNVTPMAGLALAAGAVFPNPMLAASVPLVALALGNLAMPGYGSSAMAVVVFAATAWPVLLGRMLGMDASRAPARWFAVAGSALASSLVFFVSTNAAHWWLTGDYPLTWGGLMACFAAALPFYRWMPVGDLVWTAAIFAGLSAVTAALRASRNAAVA